MLFRLMRELRARSEICHTVVSLRDNCGFNFDAIGVPVHLVRLNPIFPWPGLMRLRQLIGRLRPHVAHGWMYHGNLAVSLAGAGVPTLFSIHHSLHALRHEKASIRILVRLGSRLAKRRSVKRVIYVSRASRHHHEQHGYPSGKSVVIANGFESSDFYPNDTLRRQLRAQLGWATDEVIIGSFGRFAPVKDHALLLNAFAIARRDVPELRLLLAGSGVTEENVQLGQLLEKYQVGDSVRLLGHRNDMNALYNTIDAYVLSSRSESFPNVLGEAALCCVPTISTAVGDAAALVGDPMDIVPVADVKALAARIVANASMSSSERCRRGELQRVRIAKEFGLGEIAKRYEMLYSEIATSP